MNLADQIELAADTVILIEETGEAMQMTRTTSTGPAYDPAAGTVTGEAETVIAVRGNFNQFEIGDGSRIKSTDLKLLTTAAFDPRLYQKIGDYQIVSVKPVQPGTIVMLYIIQARL